LLFEAALGIEADLFIRMQARYNIQMAKQNKPFAERLAKIKKAVAML